MRLPFPIKRVPKRSRKDVFMENKVFLAGRMRDCSFYKAKNQVRCDILVDWMNEVTGHTHKFKIRGTGEQAVLLLLSHYPGRLFQLEGFLRGSSKGRTVIIADSMAYDADDVPSHVIMDTIPAKMATLHKVLEPSEKETNVEDDAIRTGLHMVKGLHLIDGDGKVVEEESFDDESEVKEDRDESEPVSMSSMSSMSEALDIIEAEDHIERINEDHTEEETLSDDIAEVSQSEAPLVEADSPLPDPVLKESKSEYLKRQNRDGMETEDYKKPPKYPATEYQVQSEGPLIDPDLKETEDRTEEEDKSYDNY